MVTDRRKKEYSDILEKGRALLDETPIFNIVGVDYADSGDGNLFPCYTIDHLLTATLIVCLHEMDK